MVKKTFAIIALAVLAVFAVPTAATAAGYVPASSVTVTGSATPGGTVVVNIAEGSFLAGEEVSFTVDGAEIGVRSSSVFADAAGAASFSLTLPDNATGTYTVTATGLEGGNVATASITVVAADAAAGAPAASAGDPAANAGDPASDGGDLASTGYATPAVLIWAAAGALLLGISLVVVLTLLRRQRATA